MARIAGVLLLQPWRRGGRKRTHTLGLMMSRDIWVELSGRCVEVCVCRMNEWMNDKSDNKVRWLEKKRQKRKKKRIYTIDIYMHFVSRLSCFVLAYAAKHYTHSHSPKIYFFFMYVRSHQYYFRLMLLVHVSACVCNKYLFQVPFTSLSRTANVLVITDYCTLLIGQTLQHCSYTILDSLDIR